jgi:hypothetical protein
MLNLLEKYNVGGHIYWCKKPHFILIFVDLTQKEIEASAKRIRRGAEVAT